MKSTLYKESALFPSLVKDLEDAPDYLYALGNTSEIIFSNCIAIVGSRKATAYGISVVNSIVKFLSRFNVTIVSGFMHGIDTFAHTFALKYGCQTIAVMPCGPDVIVPSKNHALYHEVLSSNGLFVSEYTWGNKPRKWFFIKRNRIIAALAHTVVIVEAGLNSGSLHTARFALGLGRKVFIVPGSIFSDVSKGTNSFLSKKWGVENIYMFTSIEDMSSVLGSNLGYGATTYSNASKVYKGDLGEFKSRILEYLNSTKLTIDDLASGLSCDTSVLSQTLFELEMGGFIEFKGGYYYAC